jgi:hypothetical protein
MGNAWLLGRLNYQDDLVSFSRYNVRMNFIQIKNNTCDERTRAVLRSSHLAHTIHVH